MYDVIIIGAGVTGNAIARELSRRERRILVLERCSDVCEGTSKANSGIVHAGFDAEPGSLKARLNVRGNQRMGELAEELDFAFTRNGSLVLGFTEKDCGRLRELKERAVRNGVPGCEILTGEEARQKEPNLSGEVKAALYAPTGGIVCPFELTIALAENANRNGVEYRFEQAVRAVEPLRDGGWRVVTGRESFDTRLVINAAGVYAAEIHNMVSKNKLSITPRKGEYLLLDKAVGAFVHSTVFQLPTKLGKGVLVTPTVHGNMLVGPNACDIEDKEGVNTTQEGLRFVVAQAQKSVPAIPVNRVITSFAGLRAHDDKGDFIIGEIGDAKGVIDVAGIESPGLSSSPAIGEYVAELVDRMAPAEEKNDFVSQRTGIPYIAGMTAEEKQKWIDKDPAFGQVVCRCELVTEGEILCAIHRPLGATTLDGIKRRTRAGMGRCQAGFCTAKTMEILARETQRDMEDITKKGGGSALLIREGR